ncbi:ATP-binding protein [Segatella hominis]|jgi:hypothetical protein|uniref:AAA family ATPase n=1 Tax=Segatella hominis TaxID=2518605 RepID=A0A4Y8VT21_9BACT|nr:ATP-binding protein [Segatella hominis]TFH83391.1 AAA family ATPase [Segatella hominis]
MKYPIGIQDFEKIIKEGYLYIDKTALLYDLTQMGKIYFLSRPRRFGKSLLVSTLKYYFEGKKELFKGLAIDDLEKEWKQYPVFHLDFNGKNFTKPGELQRTLNGFIEKQEAIYGKDPYHDTLGDRFIYVLAQAHQKTGLRAVILIDEYDKALLDVLDTGLKTKDEYGNEMLLEEENREILKGFYSVFKAADQDLQFVLLTGVTKFSQVSVFSGFNQPEDISLSAHYDTLCGITEEELRSALAQQISEMAEEYEVTEEEMLLKLRRQFDGYHFSRRMRGVYNPFSILRAFKEMLIDDYWFKTGSSTYLVRLLSHCNEQINELVGKYYPTKDFDDYKATVERPLPMIYQSGYLTIKGYRRNTNSYLLDFPNDEVRRGFVSLLASDYLKPRVSPDSWVLQVLDAMEDGECEQLHQLLVSFFASIPYTQRRKDSEPEKERYFQYTFYLVLRMISCYTVFIEKEQSEGRVDCVVETPRFVYIFEFKRDGNSADALQQIKDKGYEREYITDGRKIYKIGCSFSSETGTIDDWDVK